MDILAEHRHSYVLGSGAIWRGLLRCWSSKEGPDERWQRNSTFLGYYREVKMPPLRPTDADTNYGRSLLLLNEFHPRSMHFPPRDDEDDILTAVDEDVYNRPSDSDRPTNGDSTLAGSWSEPALRSDRMCWSLIGTSLVLAYEIGIFGRYSDGIKIQDARINRQSLASSERQRIDRIERLLYIFHLQCSGRFGLPIMYADQINRFSLADVQRDFPSGMPTPLFGINACANKMSVDEALPDPVDKTQQCWVDLMTIMKATNETLFSSKDQTAKLVQNGDYMRHLQTLQPLLRSWYERFKGIKGKVYQSIRNYNGN